MCSKEQLYRILLPMNGRNKNILSVFTTCQRQTSFSFFFFFHPLSYFTPFVRGSYKECFVKYSVSVDKSTSKNV